MFERGKKSRGGFLLFQDNLLVENGGKSYILEQKTQTPATATTWKNNRKFIESDGGGGGGGKRACKKKLREAARTQDHKKRIERGGKREKTFRDLRGIEGENLELGEMGSHGTRWLNKNNKKEEDIFLGKKDFDGMKGSKTQDCHCLGGSTQGKARLDQASREWI